LPIVFLLTAWSLLSPPTCYGVEQVYDPSPDHPWNRLHHIFYSHTFTNGETYEHEAALEPPWNTWAPFYKDQAFHKRAVTVLEEFLSQPEADLQKQAPLRRAIMLRDLWPVFDAQTNKALAQDEAASHRQAKLRQLSAKAMFRLELSEDEVRQLPDIYQAACDKKLFPPRFDAASPTSPFLPRDLFAKDAAWVPHSSHADRVGALHHVTTSNYRSFFLPLMRVADDPQVTLDFLSRYTRSRGKIAVPKGTILALARRTALPTRSGELMVTPLMESLQLIVADEPRDHHFKFVLDRTELLNGGNGLRAVTEKEPVDAYAFESGGLHPHFPKFDADGERLVFGRYAGPASQGPASLQHCFACHGLKVGRQIFANTHESSLGRVEATTYDDQVRLVLSQKRDSYSWGMYQALRDAFQ
jgi:hypothetical protein